MNKILKTSIFIAISSQIFIKTFATTDSGKILSYKLLDSSTLVYKSSDFSVQSLKHTVSPFVISVRSSLNKEGLGLLMTETIVDGKTIFCASNDIKNDICYEKLPSLKSDSHLLKIRYKPKQYPPLSVVHSVFINIKNKKQEKEIIASYAALLRNIQRVNK